MTTPFDLLLTGLKAVEALLPLRAEYADRIDLQLCAFAQEGILEARSVPEAVGGLPARRWVVKDGRITGERAGG